MDNFHFFNTVRMTRAKVVINQFDHAGYAIEAEVSHLGDDEQVQKETIHLTTKQAIDDTAEKKQYNRVPKMFKSLDSVVDLLRENKVHDFRVKLESSEIKRATRQKKEAATA